MTSSAPVARHSSHDAPFLKACRREPVPFTPVWLMRQAGRYMPEYRAVRAKVSMLELCKSPQLVAEVTTFAQEKIGADAAILFADLLLVVEPMGLGLEFTEGEGPRITPAVGDAAAIDRLSEIDPDALGYVYDAVRATRAALAPGVPLIGFAGAPFTIASYLIEGKGSRNYERTKALMYGDPGAWDALLAKIVRGQVAFLNRQIDAGCQAVQLFDSWVGALSPADYRRFVKPHVARLVDGLAEGTPVLHFGTGTATLLGDMAEAGGDVMGLDWRTELGAAWNALGPDVAVMGNLDPLTLFAPPPVFEREAQRILDEAAGRPGHVFNLGHGILPGTPVDHVQRLVAFVHERSATTAKR